MNATTRTMLRSLHGEEARHVLERLLAAHPQLTVDVEQLASGIVAEVDRERVADDVVDAYLGQSFLDINNRAGRHRGGYVHEADAQWELLEENLDPFLDELRRLVGLGFTAAAQEQAAGVLDGLVRLRDEAGEETLIGWGPLEEHTHGLAESLAHTCRDIGLDVERDRAAAT